MSNALKRIMSPSAGPFWQIVKYGGVGVAATLVQTAGFYLLGTTCLACLTPDDWAVRYLGFPSAFVSDEVRAVRFVICTAGGFVFANVFCWLMNRRFVFHAGKFPWYVEFAMFFGTATVATFIALGLSALMIRYAGLMTTLAVAIEIGVSFLLNFFVRKFFIFKG